MSDTLLPGGTSQVSVVIPSHNHAAYLPDALDSVRRQTVPALEIIVVDDGSTDGTWELLQKHPDVRSVRQENQGLSAARNAGLRVSRGEYLIFLDADDRLLPNAIEAGLKCFRENPQAAFVTGQHVRVTAAGDIIPKPAPVIPRSEHFLELLRGNYIGMHATVMYRRQPLLTAGGFDIGLPACEDYDLYLRIAREQPVATHDAVVAEYRIHDQNMSGNGRLMLATVLRVLRRQQSVAMSDPRKAEAYRFGLRAWKEYYSQEILSRLRRGAASRKGRLWSELGAVARHAPVQGAVHAVRWARRRFAAAARERLPAQVLRLLGKRRRGVWPPVGKVRFGDFRRLTPVSRRFGYERGQPIDRYYIENFLAAHADLIRGRVLEIGDNAYTVRFGGAKVSRSEVLHAVEGNPAATYVGDLTSADHIPSGAFDCIILTQTLHLIYDVRAAVRTMERILKPGGVALVTVPGISQIEDGVWSAVWHWGFTALSARRLFGEFFGAGTEAQAHGNVLASVAFLQGLAAEELTARELDHRDPLYPLLITVRAIKAGEGAE